MALSAGLLVLCFLCAGCLSQPGNSQAQQQPQTKPIPLLLPDHEKGDNQLSVAPEGLQLLQSLDLVAPIVVIGPYRSGKSFLLNQLLSVPCDAGFDVGHSRSTQTRGIWLRVWMNRQTPDGRSYSLLLVDTEGFESTGRSTAYDERIFAASALLSSLLIYNLNEAIRESDISKLSFAVQLAQGLYERKGMGGPIADTSVDLSSSSVGTAPMQKGASGSFQPGAMLWVIQRDFLEGANASDVVKQALAPVPNPNSNPEVQQLNDVRSSLASLAPTSTGYSLVQPHLERTRLCELPDSQLSPVYIRQRQGLRELVLQMAHPKHMGGMPVKGAQLADVLVRLVGALNAQEIPNVMSMLDAFNRELMARCVTKYVEDLQRLPLPQPVDVLEAACQQAEKTALELYESSQLGTSTGPGAALQQDLLKILAREKHTRQVENEATSSLVCGRLEGACEEQLESLQSMRLPSLRKFDSSFEKCAQDFAAQCSGPAFDAFEERLQKAGHRASNFFHKEYNDRLFVGLLVISLGMGLFFRFLIRSRIMEVLGWFGAVFLQVYPRICQGSMYDKKGWTITVRIWEVLMSALFGFTYAWVLWLVLLMGWLVVRRTRYGMLGWQALTRRRKAKISSGTRDLDV